MTYPTAHGNAGSLTHRVRPAIEPASSWILVGFVTTEPWWELPGASPLWPCSALCYNVRMLHPCWNLSLTDILNHLPWWVKILSPSWKPLWTFCTFLPLLNYLTTRSTFTLNSHNILLVFPLRSQSYPTHIMLGYIPAWPCSRVLSLRGLDQRVCHVHP